jgi:glycerol-3-phosphate dehydrogenase
VRSLLAKLARHVPDLREARVNAAYASIRRASGASDAAAQPPIYVVPPGSPWDARARAEALGGRVASALGLSEPSRTASRKLPGGEEVADSFVVAERLGIPEATARRLALRHGARCIDIGARIGRRRTEAAVVCACEPVLEAEIRHAVRVEHARDVGDVGRRTCLGHGACGGMRCAHRAAEVICAERALPPSEAHAMTRRFLVERWQARKPALDPALLAQEELAHARWTSASDALDPEAAE